MTATRAAASGPPPRTMMTSPKRVMCGARLKQTEMYEERKLEVTAAAQRNGAGRAATGRLRSQRQAIIWPGTAHRWELCAVPPFRLQPTLSQAACRASHGSECRERRQHGFLLLLVVDDIARKALQIHG